jgi:uncharacterized protein YciI
MSRVAILISSTLLFLTLVPVLALAEEKSPNKPEMKTYYLVFLLKGPNRGQDSTEAAKIQEAHLAHLTKMYNEGKMAIAGPLLDDQDLRGICVYDVKTLEEAKALAEADPAVKTGRLKVEVHPWMSMRGAKLP